jgi:hypothetical protein
MNCIVDQVVVSWLNELHCGPSRGFVDELIALWMRNFILLEVQSRLGDHRPS